MILDKFEELMDGRLKDSVILSESQIENLKEVITTTGKNYLECFDDSQNLFGKVISRFEDVDVNEHYDEIYHRTEDEFSFELTDYSMSLDMVNEFTEDKWNTLSNLEKIKLIESFYDTLASELKLEEVPKLYFCVTDTNFCGCFDNKNNVIIVNLAYINYPQEIIDTIAHELWHSKQFEVANSGNDERAKLYALNFNNYITSQMDFFGYEGQLIEAEARAFANQITRRNDA